MKATPPIHAFIPSLFKGRPRLYRNVTGYYPYGIAFADWRGEERYGYGGKEHDWACGLDLHDFHARQYDAQTCRFTSMDPLAEQYAACSPYVYCLSNPVAYTDPSGMEVFVGGKQPYIDIYMAMLNIRTDHKITRNNQSQLVFSEIKGIPLEPYDIKVKVKEAINNPNIRVDLAITSNYLLNEEGKPSKYINGGIFMGNTVIIDNEKSIIKGQQIIDVIGIVNSCNGNINLDAGIIAIHELIECYMGCLLHPGAKPSYTDDTDDTAYKEFLDAHKAAIEADPSFIGADERTAPYFNDILKRIRSKNGGGDLKNESEEHKKINSTH